MEILQPMLGMIVLSGLLVFDSFYLSNRSNRKILGKSTVRRTLRGSPSSATEAVEIDY